MEHIIKRGISTGDGKIPTPGIRRRRNSLLIVLLASEIVSRKHEPPLSRDGQPKYECRLCMYVSSLISSIDDLKLSTQIQNMDTKSKGGIIFLLFSSSGVSGSQHSKEIRLVYLSLWLSTPTDRSRPPCNTTPWSSSRRRGC